jgi:hypothetical protein
VVLTDMSVSGSAALGVLGHTPLVEDDDRYLPGSNARRGPVDVPAPGLVHIHHGLPCGFPHVSQ